MKGSSMSYNKITDIPFVSYLFWFAVLSAEKKRITSAPSYGGKGGIMRTTIPDRYSPLVKYRFEVSGKNYLSDRISYGGEMNSELMRMLLDKIGKEYSSGKIINVYYNPRNPKQAVMFTAFKWEVFVPFFAYIILGCAFILIGIHIHKKSHKA